VREGLANDYHLFWGPNTTTTYWQHLDQYWAEVWAFPISGSLLREVGVVSSLETAVVIDVEWLDPSKA
jgi:hypothetical protein